MCDYCSSIDTGYNYNSIIESHVDFGFLGNVDVDVYLASCITDHRNKKPYMILGLFENGGSGEFEKKVRINFCPMCGRDLRKEM